MKVEIVIETSPSVRLELGSTALASVVSALAHSVHSIPFLTALTYHPASEVRRAVAGQSHLLSDAVVEILARDSDVSVALEMISSSRAEEVLSTDILLELVHNNPLLAECVANKGDWRRADKDTIAQSLVGHSDPKVREALAGRNDLRHTIGALLVQDSEPDVRRRSRELARESAYEDAGDPVEAALRPTSVSTCTAELQFADGWFEMRVGWLPRTAVDEVARGVELSEVVTAIYDAPPDSLDSLLPAGTFVKESHTLDELAEFARRCNARAICRVDGRRINSIVRVVPLPRVRRGKSDAVEVCALEELRPLLGPNAFARVSHRYRRAAQCQAALDYLVSSGDQEDRSLWMWTGNWAGCSASAEATCSDEIMPSVLILFFATTDILPRGPEIEHSAGSTQSLWHGCSKYVLYLEAFVINNKVLTPMLDDVKDKGWQSAVIDYADTPIARAIT